MVYDRTRLRTDLVAAGLVLLGLAGIVCVLTFHPADPPRPTALPANATPANWLGIPGAWAASTLIELFGLTVYLVLAGAIGAAIWIFLRRGWLSGVTRLAGWLLLSATAAVLLDWLGPKLLLPAPLLQGPAAILPGGSLGAWLTGRLHQALLPTGQAVVVGSVLLLGVLLTADVVLIRAGKGAGILCWRMVVFLRRIVRWSWPWRTLFSAFRLPTIRMRVMRPARLAAAPARPGDRDIPIRHHGANTPTTAALRIADYELPPLALLADSPPVAVNEQDQKLREQASLLEKTFVDFGLNVKVVGINTGPVITQYELALDTGLRVNRVTALADDIALSLRAPSIRIVAPIPGKNTVGVEVPNENRTVVRLKEIILQAAQAKLPGGRSLAKTRLPLFLGKDTEGRALIHDLAEMPHLLIAGTTGTGKSVCMNAVILSLLMTRRPDEVKMIMIDPKMLEMSEYGKIPHLMHPVVKDMKKAEAILAWAVDKMEERYDILSRARVRNIAGYNELPPGEAIRRVNPVDDDERQRVPQRMPSIVIFIDEMADLMLTMKKEVEGHIIRLAQKSRAAGIHLVVATQKPTVDVITGLIKSNLPARICFQVRSRTDSRVVLDEMGAEKLLGKGDLLFLQPDTSSLIRAQGAFASNDEIQRVITHLECEPSYAQELIHLSARSRDGKGGLLESLRARDEMYEPAIDVVVREGRGSVSLLQRALGIGYGRAARLIDFMAEDGIVGAYNGSQAREVLYSFEQWEQAKQAGRLG